MKKNYIKFIESFLFLLIFGILIKFKFDEQSKYFVDVSLGNFFYIAIIYFLIKVFIPFVQNKTLKEIFRTRLNGFIMLILLVQNLIVLLNMKEYSYEEFFLLSLEKYKTGGLFVSLFGKIYNFIPKNAMLGILIVLIIYFSLYVFGKLIGFIGREKEKRKNEDFYLNKQKNKEEKIRLKKAKLEEKKIKKREEKFESIEKEEIVPSYLNEQGDFLVDIKKEFQTILNNKEKNDSKEKNIDDEKRKKIQDEIRKRHELKREYKENEEEEKTQIVFVKDESYIQEKIFKDNDKEEISLKNYEQKNLFYPHEHIELAKVLGIHIEKLQKAIELIHKDGIKGSGILEKELNVESDEAERIYQRVKKLKEYRWY